MQIESREKRKFWLNSIRNCVPDIILSIAIAMIIGDDFSLLFIGGVFIALQLIYLAIWLKKLVWVWISFYFWGREEIANNFYTLLVANNMPPPEIKETSSEGYFSKIIDNDDLSTETRLAAAYLAASLKIQTSTLYLSENIMKNIAWEDAIAWHYRGYPSS